jgi:hypothetical protein
MGTIRKPLRATAGTLLHAYILCAFWTACSGSSATDGGTDAGTDAGTVCTSPSGTAAGFDAGMVTLTGAHAFNALSGAAISCGVSGAEGPISEVQVFLAQDAGLSLCPGTFPGNGLMRLVWESREGGLDSGTYACPSLGDSTIVLLQVWDESGSSFICQSGSISLLSLTPVLVTGSLQVQLADSNGGTTALSGSFSVPGCQ